MGRTGANNPGISRTTGRKGITGAVSLASGHHCRADTVLRVPTVKESQGRFFFKVREKSGNLIFRQISLRI